MLPRFQRDDAQEVRENIGNDSLVERFVLWRVNDEQIGKGKGGCAIACQPRANPTACNAFFWENVTPDTEDYVTYQTVAKKSVPFSRYSEFQH